ncbi:MAG: DUF2851 family protein [Paludibacteraceae bacterium]|nr:DUF2851 family protein [Paludibacteraceae bacterium]
MPELLLHYIWLRKAFMAFPQTTTDGREVEVVDVGLHNMDAGPDFFNAKLRIGGVMWAGNVEIHVLSSDWYRHGHDTDPAYDSVVLHVVKRADREVYNSRGEAVVQCELRYPEAEHQLERLLQDRQELCRMRLTADPSLLTDDWKRSLLRDRMRRKTEAIDQLLELTRNNWEEAFYITLAHNFGFHTNGLPFELTARQTPLAFLLKHRNSLFQLEAMLFGQSGLLTETAATDDYSRRLLAEYRFLQQKFSLVPIDGSRWKMLRMRPRNFPHVRIAQFAALLHQSEFLFSQVVQETGLKQLRSLFDAEPSDYWQTHYRFGAQAPLSVKTLGKTAVDLLLVNTVAPYQNAWAATRSNRAGQEGAFALLEAIPAERNHITDRWRLLGLTVRTAADSQAYIQLYEHYCLVNRCSGCDVGYQIFTVKN